MNYGELYSNLLEITTDQVYLLLSFLQVLTRQTEGRSLENIAGKGENAGNHFVLFTQSFLTITFSKSFILFHAKATILLFGKELTLYQTTIFWTGPNSKYLQTTN